MTRIFQNVSLQENSILILDEKASHHLARVLRAQVGEQIIIFNGTSSEFSATVTAITKKNVEVKILKLLERNTESPLTLHLAQGIARGEKMDFIIQKAVELGVNKIIPIITERCNVRLDNAREEKRLSHWQSIIISACEQSGRNIIPQIVPPIELTKWLAQKQEGQCFVLSPHVKTTLQAEKTKPSQVTLLIGPEGGLSDDEISLCEKKNFLPLNIGPRVLRTETASIAAITILQNLYGDMR